MPILTRALLALCLLGGALLVAPSASAERVAPPSVVYLHSSGRYDRPPAQVRRDVSRWLARRHPDLATFTEFSDNHRLRALRSALPGWGLYNGVQRRGGDDAVIAWDAAVWTRAAAESFVVSRLPSYRTNGSAIPPQRVTSAVLVNRLTGQRVLISTTHMPSHVEVAGGLRVSLRAAKWRQSVRVWSRHVRQLVRQWSPSAVIVAADWNVDLRQAWVRQLLRDRFPGLRPDWRRPYPRHGTLGRRIVDFSLLGGFTPTSTRLLHTTSSDHTAYRARLDWR